MPERVVEVETTRFVNGATFSCTSLAALAWAVEVMTPKVTNWAAVICADCVPHVAVGKYDAYRLLFESAEYTMPPTAGAVPTAGYWAVGTHAPRGEYITLDKLVLAADESAIKNPFRRA